MQRVSVLALRLARFGIAHEFFGHLFEVVTRVPHRYARDPRPDVPDLRMPSLRSPGSPLRYFAPVSPITAAATLIAAITDRRDRWAAATAAQMIGSELLTVYLVRKINARLFVAGQPLTVRECWQGLSLTFVRDPLRLPEVMIQARPHVFVGMPRVWEKLHSTIQERALNQRNPLRRALASAALSVARSSGQATLGHGAPKLNYRLLRLVFEPLVYRRIRAGLGLDRMKWAAAGGAPIAVELLEFFAGIGITILEAYGMTETCAVLTFNPAHGPRAGTVGRALPGVELKLAEDGEILARGPNITPGYLNRPEATAEAIDPEGWLHTGDLGSLDEDGYLRITGRKKELRGRR